MQVSILRGARERLELPIEERGPEEVEVAAGVHGMSQIELNAFVDLVVERYQTKRMDPGTALLRMLLMLHQLVVTPSSCLMQGNLLGRCCTWHSCICNYLHE